MAHTFDYSIIRVEPDPRRGERVNVGVIVFKNGELDIRVVETKKATAIASIDWDTHIQQFSTFLKENASLAETPQDLVSLVKGVANQISMTNTGWFEASGAEDYEKEISRIISTLIKRPAPPRRHRESGIASKIAAEFRTARILASKGEDIGSGNVVRNYVVDDRAGLKADFALKNGCLHLAETVDLTTAHPHFGTAAGAAVTLDKAKKLNDGAKAYGVYAVEESRRGEVKEHLSILGDYSDDIFNWNDRDERRRFTRVFFDAYNSNHPMRNL